MVKKLGDLRTVYWRDGEVLMIDQRLLPHKLKLLRCRSYRQVAIAIKDMAIRGAPAIGVAAAYGLALAARSSRGLSVEKQLERLHIAAEELRSTRPTAVNLFWAIERVLNRAEAAASSSADIASAVLEEAERMAEEDIEINRRIGKNGADLLPERATVMTYCNAGALATVSYGTAIGVIRAATEQGKRISVIVPETRPKLQGARLTAFELLHCGIEYRVISDSMAPLLMSKGIVDCVIVGADRVMARTGHVINKVGTLGLALAARYFGVPFYVAAPLSSFDFSRKVDEVEIEERGEDEVLFMEGIRIAPKGSRALNYAFDITPPELISSVITEYGVYKPAELQQLGRYYKF